VARFPANREIPVRDDLTRAALDRRIGFWPVVVLLLCLPAANVAAQRPDASNSKPVVSAGSQWAYVSDVFPLDLKWRRHLESNLRWMIARQRTVRTGRPRPQVALFVDAGTNHLLNRNIVSLLEGQGIGCQLFDRSRVTAGNLAKLKAYIVPGGYSTFQHTATGSQGLLAIRSFVNDGGRYLGICAGAFMATRDVLWEEEHFPYPLALFDGTAEGALDKIAQWPQDAGVSLKLTAAGRQRGLTGSAEGNFYYKGGPYFHGGTDYDVLAQYQDGKAAIISRPFGQGEVVLNGIHFERPPPDEMESTDRVPPPAAAACAVFKSLLQLDGAAASARAAAIDRTTTDWVDIRDLAREDRINLEENLRWLLDRIPPQRQIVSKVRVGLFADAGVENASLARIASIMDGHGIQLLPLLHTDMRAKTLSSLSTVIMPAGDHRILRDCLADDGQQALRQFIAKGGQYIGLSTSSYMAASTVRWFGRSWEYPLEFHKGRATGPLAQIAPWPAYGPVTLVPTAAGVKRNLTRQLLSHCQYHGGPHFEETGDTKVLARYPDDTAAIIASRLGRGEVILAGIDISRSLPADSDARFLLELIAGRTDR